MRDERLRLDLLEEEGRTPSLLVVDDEAPIRHFLKVLLERLGYDVDTASGGMDAVRKAEQKSYDVVLTDLIMPRVDGLEVIRRVKELSPETEVVMITGYPSSETIVAATRAGALDYLPKSPDPEHLAVLVEKALEVRNLRRKARERDIYARMAQMDGLTELLNHDTFSRFLGQEFNRAQRGEKALSLLFADIDGFKRYNDSHGHLYGDRTLRRVADLLRHSCRSYDIVARYGGDEFAIIAPDTDRSGSEILGRRICDAMATHPGNGEIEETVSLSIGIAAFPGDADSPTELLERADTALYSAKAQGGGRICLA